MLGGVDAIDGGHYGCDRAGDTGTADSSKNRKISIGIQVSPAMTLVMVAKDAGFFEKERLDVELKEFTAGKFALQAFLAGGIDYAVSGEVPVALATLQGNPIRVVSQVVEKTTNEVRIVAWKDEGSDDARSYFKTRKRKLATSFGGGPEFFTYTFLKRYGISDSEVQLISQKPEDMPAALAAGSVDAIAIFDPFAFIAERHLKDKVTTFADETLYSELYVFNAKPEQIEREPDVLAAILRALVTAGDFIESNPERAKQILEQYTKLDREIIDGIWGNFVFRPALTRRLIDNWTAQAEWAVATDKVKAGTQAPDFPNVVDGRFLDAVRSDLIDYDKGTAARQ